MSFEFQGKAKMVLKQKGREGRSTMPKKYDNYRRS